jgi:hypothetical protein
MTKEWKGSLDEQRNINDDNHLRKRKLNFKICKSSGMQTQVKAKHIHTYENTWKNKKYIDNNKLWERCENNKNKHVKGRIENLLHEE